MLKEKTTYEIISPETIGIKESKLVIGKHSGSHAFREKLSDLGYELTDEALNEAFAKFKDLADRKKNVTDEDLLAMWRRSLSRHPRCSPSKRWRFIRQSFHTQSAVTIIVVGNGSAADG